MTVHDKALETEIHGAGIRAGLQMMMIDPADTIRPKALKGTHGDIGFGMQGFFQKKPQNVRSCQLVIRIRERSILQDKTDGSGESGCGK